MTSPPRQDLPAIRVPTQHGFHYHLATKSITHWEAADPWSSSDLSLVTLNDTDPFAVRASVHDLDTTYGQIMSCPLPKQPHHHHTLPPPPEPRRRPKAKQPATQLQLASVV